MKRFFFTFVVVLLLTSPSLLPAQSYDSSDEQESESTGGQYPAEVQGADTNEIGADRDQLGKFQKLDSPGYSRDLKIASQTQNETRPKYYVLDGYVDIAYQGMRLQADHAEYDATTKDLVATGNVVLDQQDQHLTGNKLELNLDTKKGNMYDARGFIPPQIFFWGTRLEKLGEEEYKLYDGIFTECSQIVPHWKLNSTTARMTINEYIHFKNFLIKAKSLPLFYSPYMMWPIRRDRATGFLFPSFGPNDTKGFYVGGSFFWAMGDSMDTTYWVDHYQERGWGGGAEYRYAESKESLGSIKAYAANDNILGRQWTIDGAVKQELPADFRLSAIVDYFSSFEYVRDFAKTLQGALRQTKTAQGFLTRNWSYYSLNFLGNWSEREGNQTGASSSFYHVPEVEFQSRNQQLGGTPFFWTLLSSFDELGRANTFANNTSKSFFYQRYDALPAISFPITYLSWLTFTPTFGERITYYSSSQNKVEGIVDDPLTRTYHQFALDFRGPNFGKIFDTPGRGYAKKWKHAIEPQVIFEYLQDITERPNIIQIDEVDSVLGERQITYSLTNLLYAKRPVKEEEEYEPDEYQYYNPKPLEEAPESAWELISWRVSQSYRFDSDSFNKIQGQEGVQRISPITSVLRVNPTVHYNISFATEYDLHFTQLTRIQLAATLRDTDRWYSNLSYVYSNPTPFSAQPGVTRIRTVAGNSIQTNAGVGLWKKRVVLSGTAGIDITQKDLLSSSLGFVYNDDCFSVGVEWRHFSEVFRINGKENQITFSISLPNIGNLVSFQSGAPPRRF